MKQRVDFCTRELIAKDDGTHAYVYTRVATAYGTITYSGGRESLMASRIVHDYEAVATIRWRPDIEPSMFVKLIDDPKYYNITAMVPEGYKKTWHVKFKVGDEANCST